VSQEECAILGNKEYPPEVWHIPPGTPCILDVCRMDIIILYLASGNETGVMNDKSTVILQSCTAFLKSEPGSITDTWPTSHDEKHITDIKVEEDPVRIEFPDIKTEYEVSCMVVCPLLGLFSSFQNQVLFVSSQSVC
jgi:hypothetical protein